jgi:hypothetical protein
MLNAHVYIYIHIVNVYSMIPIHSVPVETLFTQTTSDMLISAMWNKKQSF